MKNQKHLPYRRRRRPPFLLLAVAAALWICSLLPPFCSATSSRRTSFDSVARFVRVVNHSQVKLDVFYISNGRVAHSNTDGEGLLYGAYVGINSFVGHSFQVEELPSEKTGTCRRKVCRKAYFRVTPNDNQVFTIQPDFFIQIDDHKTRAKAKAKAALLGCTQDVQDSKQAEPLSGATQQVDQLAACLEQTINATLQETQNEIVFQSGLRDDIGIQLMEYACDDDTLQTTETIKNRSWTFHSPMGVDIYHDVEVIFDAQYSSIMLVPNFLLPQQCRYIQGAAEQAASPDSPGLQHWSLPQKSKDHATLAVLLNKITSLLHESLRLDVAYDTDLLSIKMYKEESPFPPAAPVQTEHDKDDNDDEDVDVPKVGCLRHLPTSWREKHGYGSGSTWHHGNGQEAKQEGQCPNDLAAMAGREEDICFVADDDESDENVVLNWTLPAPRRTTVENENVVASILVFCGGEKSPSSPIKGGAIYFPRTGVHVRPRAGLAVLMLYQDPRTGERDKEQFIHEYVSCPVKEGSLTTFVDHFSFPTSPSDS